VAAAKVGLMKAPLEAEHPFVDEVPFDSERKMMTVVRLTLGQTEAYTKGAAGAVLRHCTRYAADDGSLLPLNDTDRDLVRRMEHTYAKQRGSPGDCDRELPHPPHIERDGGDGEQSCPKPEQRNVVKPPMTHHRLQVPGAV